MRQSNQTKVNVVVDRSDRTNVVGTLFIRLRRLCLCLREACAGVANKFAAQPGLPAMYAAAAVSPSWGGHRLSGGSGHATRS